MMDKVITGILYVLWLAQIVIAIPFMVVGFLFRTAWGATRSGMDFADTVVEICGLGPVDEAVRNKKCN